MSRNWAAEAVSDLVTYGLGMARPQTMQEMFSAISTQGVRPTVVVDMDGTLTPSSGDISDEMVSSVLDIRACGLPFAILTSAGIENVRKQVLDKLLVRADDDARSGLFILPNQGGQGYSVSPGQDALCRRYHLDLRDPSVLGDEGVNLLIAIVDEVLVSFGVQGTAGSLALDRGSQITLMMLGPKAGDIAKAAYDRLGGRRERLMISDSLNDRFRTKNMAVRAGPAGKTSINIGPSFIDKAFGIRKLETAFGRSIWPSIYIADEFGPNGVDSPVPGRVWAAINVGAAMASDLKDAGVIQSVSLGPDGTKSVLNGIVRSILRTAQVLVPAAGSLNKAA